MFVRRSIVFMGAGPVRVLTGSICLALLFSAVVAVDTDSPSGAQPSEGSRISWTWDWRNVLGLVLTALFAAISGPGGQSGNWWYVPCFAVVLQFGISKVIPLCTFVVFMGALSSVAYALWEEHPQEQGETLVDYEAIAIIAPALLLGTVYGVMLNTIMPGWLLEALIVVAFAWSWQKMLRSYLKLRADETARQLLADGIDRELTALLADEGDSQQTAERSPDAASAPGEKPTTGAAGAAAQRGVDKRRDVRLTLGTVGDALKQQLKKLHRLNQEVAEAEALNLRHPMMRLTPTHKLGQESAAVEHQEHLDQLQQEGEEMIHAEKSLLGLNQHHQQQQQQEEEAASEVTAQPVEATGLRRRPSHKRVAQLAANSIRHILPAAADATGPAAEGAGGDAQPPTATAREESGATSSSRSSRVSTALEKLHAWWVMQPKLLQVLLLLQLAVHFTASVLLHVSVPPCTPASWTLIAVDTAAMGVLMAVGVVIVRRRQAARAAASSATATLARAGSHEERAAAGALRPAPRVQWTKKVMVQLPSTVFVAGIAAAMLGLGGGFLINPILLGLNVHPQVVGGTAKIILLLSVASTSAAYLLTGRVLVSYGLAYGMVVLVMTPVGIWAMDWVISRTGRASHLVLLALVRFAVGIVLVVAFDFVPAMVHLAHAGMEGFHLERLCEQH